jgi:hypothetical protein
MEHTLRKPVESRRAYAQRRKTIVWGMILALGLALAIAILMIGCSSGPNATTTSTSATQVAMRAAAHALASGRL